MDREDFEQQTCDLDLDFSPEDDTILRWKSVVFYYFIQFVTTPEANRLIEEALQTRSKHGDDYALRVLAAAFATHHMVVETIPLHREQSALLLYALVGWHRETNEEQVTHLHFLDKGVAGYISKVWSIYFTASPQDWNDSHS